MDTPTSPSATPTSPSTDTFQFNLCKFRVTAETCVEFFGFNTNHTVQLFIKKNDQQMLVLNAEAKELDDWPLFVGSISMVVGNRQRVRVVVKYSDISCSFSGNDIVWPIREYGEYGTVQYHKRENQEWICMKISRSDEEVQFDSVEQ